jgi:hypothetical protein
MALWGLVTGRDLSTLGTFLFWSLIAWVGCAAVATLFGAAPAIFVVSALGVLLFALYTAHDVAWVVVEASGAADAEAVERIAIEGAISLYLDIANLFLDVMRLLSSFSWLDWG